MGAQRHLTGRPTESLGYQQWRWVDADRDGSVSAREGARFVWEELLRDGGAMDMAALVAYWSLLALFPFGILALSLVAYVPLHGLDQELIDFVWQVMPHDVAQLCDGVLREVVGKQHGALLVVALVGAMWTSSGAVSATMSALNHAWGAKETRPYWHKKGLSLLVTLGGALVVVLAMIALLVTSVVGQELMQGVFPGRDTHLTGAVFGYSVVCGSMLCVSWVCYRLLPDLRGPRAVWPGMLFVTCAWITVSLGFAFYLTHFAAYGKVYGALGTMVVLMTWLYLGAMMLLLGGALNSAWEHTVHASRNDEQRVLA